ncbi:MAG: tetratricopeptide repeat protein [Anaerolineae bacterium]|nr:tetratricopeptide repeat protein [Anaerolineae bacterium]
MRQNKTLLIIIVMVVVGGIGFSAYLLTRPSSPAEVDLDEIQLFIDEGQYATARDQLIQLVATDSNNAEAQFLLGLAYFNLEEYGDAEASFRKALELDSDRAAAVHHNLGVLAFQLGDMQTALNEFRAALEADPGDPDSHYQLGATYLVMAFPPGAVQADPDLLQQSEEQFELSLGASPDKPEALVGLANIYLLQNDLSQAINLLEKAVASQPKMREALFALGRAYAFSGQTAEAQSTLELFLETDPPAQWKQQAEELLAQLE